MNIEIAKGVFMPVSVDYYEPACAGGWDEPPSGEYIEWSTDCERSQALIDLSEDLYEALTEKVLEQYKSDGADDAADAAISAYEHEQYMREAM